MIERKGFSKGTTQYLYGNLSNPFQVTASRAPDNTLAVYYYDDYNALYALERGGVRYYVGSDHLGTPKVITDNTGNGVRQIEYDSWGVKIGYTNPSFDLPVGFAGGIPDDTTGLVRFGFRDYEPGTGRWLARDPVFFRGGQANLYGYNFNDPLNLIDRNGLGQPGYWTRVGRGFATTNNAVPGSTVLTGSGLATSDYTAENLGTKTFLQWAKTGALTAGEATFTSLETFVLAGGTALTNWALMSAAYESGVLVGSMIDATGYPEEAFLLYGSSCPSSAP